MLIEDVIFLLGFCNLGTTSIFRFNLRLSFNPFCVVRDHVGIWIALSAKVRFAMSDWISTMQCMVYVNSNRLKHRWLFVYFVHLPADFHSLETQDKLYLNSPPVVRNMHSTNFAVLAVISTPNVGHSEVCMHCPLSEVGIAIYMGFLKRCRAKRGVHFLFKYDVDVLTLRIT